jgi:nitrilase
MITTPKVALPNDVRVGLVQAAPMAFNLAESLKRVRHYLEQASRQGVQLLIFPEAFLTGYLKGATLNIKIGERGEGSREAFAAYWRDSVAIESQTVETLKQWCQELRLTVVIGIVEQEGGTLYCSVLYLSPEGTLLGKHRKLVPTGMERVIWGQGDGQTLEVVSTPVGRVGAAICWENYMPLLRQHYYNQGIEFYCAPTVDDRESWQATLRHIAMEGRCFVLSACQFAVKADYPQRFQEAVCHHLSDEQALIRGGSCVVDPLGNWVIEPVYDRSDLLVATLDRSLLVQGKLDLDVAGHSSRPDVFQFSLR